MSKLMINGFGRLGMASPFVAQSTDDVTITPSTALQEINYINYMENKSYDDYVSGLTSQQQNMLKQGSATIKEWGENDYEFVFEVENEGGQKKWRNNAQQKEAMKRKQIAARRKKNKIKHKR